MAEIRQFDRVYCFCNDKGKPISDPFLTIEEAERAMADWHLTDELEQELVEVVVSWAGRRAEALGRPRREILEMVRDWTLANYGTKGW